MSEFLSAAEVREFQIGDKVSTDYTGRTTHHRVIELRFNWRPSQSGLGVRVEPMLRNWRDTSNPFDEWPREFYDSDWFKKP